MRALLPTIGRTGFPPVGRLAISVGMLQDARAACRTWLPARRRGSPRTLRRALVAVQEIVELQDVDLARIESLKPRPQTLDSAASSCS